MPSFIEYVEQIAKLQVLADAAPQDSADKSTTLRD